MLHGLGAHMGWQAPAPLCNVFIRVAICPQSSGTVCSNTMFEQRCPASLCPCLPVLVLPAGCKQSAAKRGAATVLSSLVSSAREVFKLLAGVQLEDPSAPGVSFPLLLRMVRERFILNTEHALKSVLTEFRDHELIKLRVGQDGGDVMYIPMEPDVLQKALQEMEAAAVA